MSDEGDIHASARLSNFGARLVGTLVLFAALGTAITLFFEIDNFSAAAMETMIRSWGAWGVVASIGCMVLHSFVPFPAEFLAIANGMVYGPVWGTVITWVGAMLGAFMAFELARAFGRPLVEFAVAKKNWSRLDNWTEAQGWRLVFVSRFIPVIAFNLVNYAAGLARISWWTFAWSTGIGILPMTIMMVLIGSYSEFIAWEFWMLVAVSVMFLWLGFKRKFFRNKFFTKTSAVARNTTASRTCEERKP